MYLLAITDARLDWDNGPPGPPLPNLPSVVDYPHVQWYQLESRDWVWLNIGRQTLLDELTKLTASTSSGLEHPGCDTCMESLQKGHADAAGRLQPADYHLPDPLKFLSYLTQGAKPSDYQICDACWKKARDSAMKSRQRIWDDLLHTFEID